MFRFCLSLWKSGFWVRKGLGDAYNRLIKPWLSRHVRSDLTATAQKEAVKTFTTNLEKYLLTEPIKNRTILGLDPGFRAGCKVFFFDNFPRRFCQIRICQPHHELLKFTFELLLTKYNNSLYHLLFYYISGWYNQF